MTQSELIRMYQWALPAAYVKEACLNFVRQSPVWQEIEARGPISYEERAANIARINGRQTQYLEAVSALSDDGGLPKFYRTQFTAEDVGSLVEKLDGAERDLILFPRSLWTSNFDLVVGAVAMQEFVERGYSRTHSSFKVTQDRKYQDNLKKVGKVIDSESQYLEGRGKDFLKNTARGTIIHPQDGTPEQVFYGGYVMPSLQIMDHPERRFVLEEFGTYAVLPLLYQAPDIPLPQIDQDMRRQYPNQANSIQGAIDAFLRTLLEIEQKQLDDLDKPIEIPEIAKTGWSPQVRFLDKKMRRKRRHQR